MNSPVVSIITPVFNSASTLAQTIETVRAQSFENWELILINDASKDHSAAIIEKYAKADARIQPMLLEENGGAAKARNLGIMSAKGRYIAFLDSDDHWTPTKLERQLEFMEAKNAALSHTSYAFMDPSGEPLNKVVHARPVTDYEKMLDTNYIGCLTAMIDTQKIGKPLMPDIRKRQDYAYWLKIMRMGYQAFGLDECLAHYRVGSDSLSSNKWKAAQYNYKLLTEIEGLPKGKALMHMLKYMVLSVKKHYLS